MSGASGSRSATDPIWGSGHTGRVQHLKYAWAAERPRWVWGQASSCCVLRGISGLGGQTRMERKVLESLKDVISEKYTLQDEETKSGSFHCSLRLVCMYESLDGKLMSMTQNSSFP